MCKSYRVDSFLEPLLSKLILDDPNIDGTRYNRASMGLTRGGLVVPGLNGSFYYFWTPCLLTLVIPLTNISLTRM
ncbi:hypothetical protein P9112_012884 [Eukaryota sp. TZLM1-RC]